MTDWLDDFLLAHHDELIAFRRHLHAHPELSYQEHATTELLSERLRVSGLSPQVLSSGTGLVCDVGAGDGPLVALRADIDALAMEDETETPYRSQVPGRSHACGHDLHTTIVLGAGLALAAAPGSDECAARLLFEPAEESVPGGAPIVIADGGLDGVAAVFGFHADPKLDVGRVGLRQGPLTSAADMVEITLHGPGGHTARPHLTVDLAAVAGRVAAGLTAAVAARAADRGDLLAVLGAIHTGDAANVIPTTAVLRGSVRTPDRTVWADAESILTAAVVELTSGSGARVEIDYRRGVPPVVNHPAETALMASVVRRELGPEGVVEASQSLGGDTFAWYQEHVPGCYARLGVHDPRWGVEKRDLHSGAFDVDERAIAIGVRILVRAALERQRVET